MLKGKSIGYDLEPVFHHEVVDDPDGNPVEIHGWWTWEEKTNEEQDRANLEAMRTGSSPVPVDVGTTGTTVGFVPQGSPTAPEQSTVQRVGAVVGGMAGGLFEMVFHQTKDIVLNFLTFGGYGVFKTGWGFYEGYQKEGLWGAAKTVIPFYGLVQTGINIYEGVQSGDDEKLGRSLAPVAGAEAGAEEAGKGTGVARGATSNSSYVYQLVDDAGDPVYYGTTSNPAIRIGRHALQPPGPFRGMQVISETLPRSPGASAGTGNLAHPAGDSRGAVHLQCRGVVDL